MINTVLSSVAQAGVAAFTIYMVKPKLIILWDAGMTPDLSPAGWICLINIVLVAAIIVLVNILPAFILVCYVLCNTVETVTKNIKVLLRTSASLPLGR
ncbi:hypothetical protein FHW04_004529 [Pantoea sp. AN62]|uniref:hypothetical protein n=1 Tax=Pantoea TaxID=53335 RepID=UPI000A24CCB1|nr:MULTISPECIES: hypothetical protein [Pantoea]MCQ5472806.1 hypothetical protein [Pantoea brenneri]MDU4748680.1 hypothetical protein [Pantoea sp.]ORM54203.1 hypothetical protein HA39_17810 [Pantoea brenneri]OXM18664.1 hypothetical protein CBI35_21750 [Pantoea sp. AV62]